MTNKETVNLIIDTIRTSFGMEEGTVIVLDHYLFAGNGTMRKHKLAEHIEGVFSIDIEVETCEAWKTAQDVIDTVTNELAGRIQVGDKITLDNDDRTFVVTIVSDDPRGPGSFYEWNGGRFKGQNHMTPEEENAYLSADGQSALNNMPVINRITRADVEGFRDTVAHFNMPHNTLSYYQQIATKSAIYPGQGTPIGLDYVALKLNGEAGEFAEHVGKAMRDDRFITIIEGAVSFEPLTPERRTAIIKEIGDILWYASAACNELGITLSEAALINLEKLCDRSERDALRGSGDER